MKLTKTELKNIIKESVKEVLNENKQNLDEISINAKRRNERNIEKVFNKKPLKTIKTLCVFTANNPDSTQTSSKFNKKIIKVYCMTLNNYTFQLFLQKENLEI